MLRVYAVYNDDREPLAVGLANNNDKTIYSLYGRGQRTTLYEVEQAKEKIANSINSAIANNITIYTSDFKSLLAAFPIEKARGVDYNVYDLCWHSVDAVTNTADAVKVTNHLLDRLSTAKVKQWQKIFANAAVVYQALEDRGVLINDMLLRPLWSQQTYSGRSKNLVVNIQGADGIPGLANPSGSTDDVHIYFDWVAADVRVASLLSGDKLLQDSFVLSDPYSTIETIITDESGTIPRHECKIQFLQALNSFDFSHPILEDIYSGLGKWLAVMKKSLDDSGYLSSILGRKFSLASARNHLAVLNGVLQGSVAHAMQLVIKKIWDLYGDQLLVEIHDSISMTAKPEHVNSIISTVVPIMTRPFASVIEDNPFFPVKVSIGAKFRDWHPFKIYRERNTEKINGQTVKKSTKTAKSCCQAS